MYDANGDRVLATVDGETTVYIDDLFEYQRGARTSYFAGVGGPVALRREGHDADNGVFYLLDDHLDSTSVILNQDGSVSAQHYYFPFGGNRGAAFSDVTTKRFTGQYHEAGLPGAEGLSFYNARWYDAQLGRFVSADTLVPRPANPQSLNRLSYVMNNPLRFTDPTGHYIFEDDPSVPYHPPTPYTPPSPPPRPKTTKLWIDPAQVTGIQIYGNTKFAFYLDGTGPSYAYSQGFHAGLDLVAPPGTSVIGGIGGEVLWVSDRDAYEPRYIVIKIAPDTAIVIGHLSAENPPSLKAGDLISPDTIVGEVSDAEGHVHIEIWTGSGTHLTENRMIQVPYQYMSYDVREQFFALANDMDKLDERITFHDRSDGLWSSWEDQPPLIYNGPNLNIGQPGYSNPWGQ